MNVNSLLEGASPLQHQQGEAAKLASKWEKSGLLEGLNGHESEKSNMAVLLENQARQLVNEANSLGASGAGTSITAGQSEAWAGVALPLVRRVFGEIVAKDLVSVQPMNLPSGLIFYLDFQYGDTDPSGRNLGGFAAGDSLYAANSDKTKTVLPTAGQSSGLYGPGRFGYTLNEKTLDLSSGRADAASSTAYQTGSLTRASYNSNFEFEAITGSNTFNTITIRTQDLEANFDADAVRSFALSGSTKIHSVFNEFTQLNEAGTELTFVVSCSNDLAAADKVKVFHSVNPVDLDDRNDYEDGSATAPAQGSGNVSTLEIPSIDVKLNSDTVTAKTRKLKAQWTPEFAQDLNAYHSIDAEAELTSILSEYISMEIDLELLDMLIRNADTVNHWSAKVGVETSDSGVRDTAGTNEYYTRMSWFQTLGIKLQSVSNTIHQKTLRGGANFMVVSPKVSTVLESIPGFAADSPGDSNKYAMGVQKIGAINSRYTVYKNPYMTENVILMGYKGNQFLETGAVFAPYIPLIMTPLVYDPVSFTPRKGIMTRYAKKMVRPDFYGKIFIQDLNLV